MHDTVKIARMIKEINPQKKDIILEIGPGSGVLTREFLKKAGKVIAVEIDKDAIEKLKEKTSEYNNLKIIHGDFLELDIKKLYEEQKFDLNQKFLVAGNIPYYITGPIIEKIIENRKIIDCAYLTIQKEVAERIVAKEGSKKYGTLSVFVQFYSEPHILFQINRKAFFPEPKVDSAFIKLILKQNEPQIKDHILFFKIVKAAFSERRKKVVNNLSKSLKISKNDIAEILNNLKIPLNVRAENISLVDFIRIFDNIYEKFL